MHKAHLGRRGGLPDQPCAITGILPTGKELWRHVFAELKTCQLSILTTDETTATNPLSPMGNQRSVYVAGAGRVFAVDITTGKKIWQKKMSSGYADANMGGSNVNLCIDKAGKNLFVAQEGMVHCLDANTSSTIWKMGLTRTGYDVVTILIYDDDGEASCTTHTASPQTPPHPWSSQELILAASRGRVFCFAASTGHQRWEVTPLREPNEG